jgi:hypothetical protein
MRSQQPRSKGPSTGVLPDHPVPGSGGKAYRSGSRAEASAVPGRLSTGSGWWRCGCWPDSGRLKTFLHLVDLVGHQTVRLAVHSGGSRSGGCLDQAEDFPALLVDPVPQVPDVMAGLDLQVGYVAVAAASMETAPLIVCTSMNSGIPASSSARSSSPLPGPGCRSVCSRPSRGWRAVGGGCSLRPRGPHGWLELHRRLGGWRRVGGLDDQAGQHHGQG